MEVTGKLPTLVYLHPRKKIPVTEYKRGSIPELVYTMWRAGQFLLFAHD
jgi:hypothetical protein